MRTLTVNLFTPVFIVFALLLALGTIPFTAASVVLLVFLSHINVDLTWTR